MVYFHLLKDTLSATDHYIRILSQCMHKLSQVFLFFYPDSTLQLSLVTPMSMHYRTRIEKEGCECCRARGFVVLCAGHFMSCDVVETLWPHLVHWWNREDKIPAETSTRTITVIF